MPAKEKFVCRVCGSSEGYVTISYSDFLPLCYFYYCKACSIVFMDPKKFSNQVRGLSKEEINELIKLGEDFGGDDPGKIPIDAPNY